MSPVIPKSSYLTGRFACRLPDFHFSSCSSSICSCPGGTMTSVTAIKAGQGQCLQGPWFGVSGAAWWQGFPRHFTTSLRDYLSSKIEDRCLLDPTFGHKIEMVSVTCMTPCGTWDRKIHPSVLPVFQRWDKNTLVWQISRQTSPAKSGCRNVCHLFMSLIRSSSSFNVHTMFVLSFDYEWIWTVCRRHFFCSYCWSFHTRILFFMALPKYCTEYFQVTIFPWE